MMEVERAVTSLPKEIKLEEPVMLVAEEVLEEAEAARVQSTIGQFARIASHQSGAVVDHAVTTGLHIQDQHLALEGLVQEERAEMNQHGLSQNRINICEMLRNEGRIPTWPTLFDQVLEEEDGIAFAGVCSSLQAALRLKELYEDETVTQYRAKSTVATFGNTEFQRTKLRRATFRLMDVRLYSPIFILAKNRYVCHKGPDIDKGLKERRKKANSSMMMDEDDEHQPGSKMMKDKRKKGFGSGDHSGGMRYKKPRLCQPTKKVGCPATLTMYEVLITNCEDADFDDELSWKVRIQTQEIELKRFVVIFLPHFHEGHAIGQSTASGVTRSWHPDVRAHLTSLLEDGIRDPEEMMRHLKAFVEHKLCVGYTTKPSLDDRRYYPLRTDVRNAMSYDLKEKKVTTRTDQDHLASLVQCWATDDPNGHIIFRPYAQHDNGEVQSLLLVHQSSNQQYLMQRYGGEAVFLDATSSYGIPLYFLSVKTNYSFQVVATIWMNADNAESIAEALQLIKSWNAECEPSCEPRFAMCELDEKQFAALQSTWPNTQLLLCDFTREQDWIRWLGQPENGLQQSKNHILGLLRKIANADTEEQYVEAQERLMSDATFANSPALQAYYGNTYATIVDRWVRWYRQSMRIRADSSSANERKILTLKKHQQRCVGGSLTSIAETIKQINETMWHEYCKANLTDSSSYKPYELDEPVLHLANRPAAFRDRQLKSQQGAALFLDLCSDIPSYFRRIDTGVFLARSFNSSLSEEWHRVDFGSEENDPFCTCCTFRKHKMPCQHFYAIFTVFEDVSWASLPTSYREMPFFVLDPKCLKATDNLRHIPAGATAKGQEKVHGIDSDALRKVNIFNLIGLLDRIKASAYLVDEQTLSGCLRQVESVVNFVEKAIPEAKQGAGDITDETTISSAITVSVEVAPKSTIPIIWDSRHQPNAHSLPITRVPMSNGESPSVKVVPGKYRLPKKVRQSTLATQREKQRQFIAQHAEQSYAVTEQQKDVVSGNEVWVHCENITLTNQHRALLHEELDDTIITVALKLLKREDHRGNLTGLLSPCLVASLQFEGRHSTNLVQIVATSSTKIGHWICVSTVGTVDSGHVDVYDSLVTASTDVDDTYSHFVKTQIAALLTLPIDQQTLVMNVAACTQQEGSLACGLFAIAYATDLVFYEKIVGSPDQPLLAAHLEACITAGRMTPFPKIKDSDALVAISQPFSIQVPVYCVCRLPYSENRDCDEDLMVKCCDDDCPIEWYHLRCVSQEDRQRAKEFSWCCERCS